MHAAGVEVTERTYSFVGGVAGPWRILRTETVVSEPLPQALAIRDASGSSDVSYHAMKGAPHYLEGHRKEAMSIVADLDPCEVLMTARAFPLLLTLVLTVLGACDPSKPVYLR
jgi:hypothetical protein